MTIKIQKRESYEPEKYFQLFLRNKMAIIAKRIFNRELLLKYFSQQTLQHITKLQQLKQCTYRLVEYIKELKFILLLFDQKAPQQHGKR